MADFEEQIKDGNRLKDRLFDALNKNKPFSRFKLEIDNSGEFRQKWFDFKLAKLENWVTEKLEEIQND